MDSEGNDTTIPYKNMILNAANKRSQKILCSCDYESKVFFSSKNQFPV